jgi:hypothetical protein
LRWLPLCAVACAPTLILLFAYCSGPFYCCVVGWVAELQGYGCTRMRVSCAERCWPRTHLGVGRRPDAFALVVCESPCMDEPMPTACGLLLLASQTLCLVVECRGLCVRV